MRRFYPLILILVVFIVWYYRQGEKPQEILVSGQTMGTTYSVKYLLQEPVSYKSEIDSILVAFNNSLSTYIPDSEISIFNQDSVFSFSSPFFYEVLVKSSEVYQKTDGAFDPTVMPLVNYWGFGPEKVAVDLVAAKTDVDSLRKYVGFGRIKYDNEKVWKEIQGIELDFSAIAKGYGVDIVAEFLELQGVENYFVEIGGEIRTKGLNKDGALWRIGIEDPTSGLNSRATSAIIGISDRSMATSGNYRNFYIKDGVKVAHTIDPATGFPVEHSLLSATVLADDCMTADAYATAFMVLGREKAIEISESLESVDVFLIYGSASGTEGFETYASAAVREMVTITP